MQIETFRSGQNIVMLIYVHYKNTHTQKKYLSLGVSSVNFARITLRADNMRKMLCMVVCTIQTLGQHRERALTRAVTTNDLRASTGSTYVVRQMIHYSTNKTPVCVLCGVQAHFVRAHNSHKIIDSRVRVRVRMRTPSKYVSPGRRRWLAH